MEDYKSEYEKEHTLRLRNSKIIDCMARWISLKQNNINVMDFFLERNCRRIAIYGASRLGRLAYDEIISSSQLEPVCFFDQNAEKINRYMDFKASVYDPSQYMDHVKEFDAVLVTPIFFFDRIEAELLRKKPEIPIISFETIIFYGEQKA